MLLRNINYEVWLNFEWAITWKLIWKKSLNIGKYEGTVKILTSPGKIKYSLIARILRISSLLMIFKLIKHCFYSKKKNQ